METYTLLLKKKSAFRDYINQYLANTEQDVDTEWWTNPCASEALNQLAGSKPWAVSDSLDLHIENGGNLVVAIWNGETSTQDLALLEDDIYSRLEHMVENWKSTYIPAWNGNETKREFVHSSAKLEINFLFFTKDAKSRIFLEMGLDPKLKSYWKRTIQKKYKVSIFSRCTYVVYPEYHGELARIRGISRYNSLQMEPISGRSNTESQCECPEDMVQSTVVTVQLKELVELYNQVGDPLFRYNVRFGIGEALDVSKAIRKTLSDEPQRFWFKNNGITLLVEDPDFRLEQLDELRLGKLEAGRLPQFSIINGAQTITISSRYAFELEYKNQVQPECKECKEQWENFAKAQVLLRVIHVPVQLEEDETEDKSVKIQEMKNLVRDISVSLNRQKPIKAEDIAFTTPFVRKMVEYLSEPQNDPPFQLIRRGEEQAQISQLSLLDFSKARLACVGRPDRARTASGNDILKMDFAKGTLQDTDVFVERWMTSEDDEQEIFQRFYGAVWFADQIARAYAKNARSLVVENINAQTAIQNGKWYFTSLVVQLLNQFRQKDNQPDFSEFYQSLQTYGEAIPQAMEAFSRMADYCTDKGHQLDSNDFKSEKYYRQLLTELEHNKKAAPFAEFSNLFVPASSEDATLLPQRSKRQKITVIALGNDDNYIDVISAKEAFEKTVSYILENFSPEADLLTQFDSWLTTDYQKITSSIGNFDSNSVSVFYRGRKYWIGSKALNNNSKFSRICSLCKLALVPQGEISWLADNTILYQW